MKSQIFAGIALLVAGVFTVELNKTKEPQIEVREVKVFTTKEIIEKSSLNHLKEEIREQEDSTSYLIRETIQDKVVDSAIQSNKDSVIK